MGFRDLDFIVHIAYIDESFSRDKNMVVVGAIVIPHHMLAPIEINAEICALNLKGIDALEEIDEFHSGELFHGEGAFEGISEPERFKVIHSLLGLVAYNKFPFIYSAIKIPELKRVGGLFASANPLDVAFRCCLLGVEDWIRSCHGYPPGPNPVMPMRGDAITLCIADQPQKGDQKLINDLTSSYRQLRKKRPLTEHSENRLVHLHDAMYFGNSKDSVGIQMADLCAYFIQRHLMKLGGSDAFCDMARSVAICARPLPYWTEYPSMFMEHVEISGYQFSKAQTSEPTTPS